MPEAGTLVGIVGLLILAVVILWNVGWSLWLAYSFGRDGNSGGYPILGHAVHTFFLFFFVGQIVRELGWDSPLLRWAIALGMFAGPVLHAWLIYRVGELGCHEGGENETE